MVVDMNNWQYALPLPIAQISRNTAMVFSREQLTPEKQKQVQLNTLAVLTVYDYLNMMQVPTSLENTDSWEPIVRSCADVADLEIIEIGRLECRPLQGDRDVCSIPPEVWEDRIGYIVVKISDDLQEANILGFTQHAAVEELPLNQLQPIEEFFPYIAQLKNSFASNHLKENIINLEQWLAGIFTSGWQTLESFLTENQLSYPLNFAFRGDRDVNVFTSDSGIRCAKVLTIAKETQNISLGLILGISTNLTSEQIDLYLQLHPLDRDYLLPNLSLQILDKNNRIFLEAISGEFDDYLQIDFYGARGEQFQLKIKFQQQEFQEYFII
jgi:hypothetical protein